jgi:hypothetical protein
MEIRTNTALFRPRLSIATAQHSIAACVRTRRIERSRTRSRRCPKRHRHKLRRSSHGGRSRASTLKRKKPEPPSVSIPKPVPPAAGTPANNPAANNPAESSRAGSSPPDAGGTSGGESASLRLFAPTSVWNMPLATDAPLDRSSSARMSAFDTLIAGEEKANTGPWIEETEYSTPLYVVGPEQPRVDVHLDSGLWAASLQGALSEGVPIPRDATPAAGTDGAMTIYQPSSDTLWEFWRAFKTESGWRASWGGAMQHASESSGYYSDASWPALAPSQGWNWGGTATSLPVIAGTVRIAELRSGHIEHALALDVPYACAHDFSFPAQRSDGSEQRPDCIPEGAHMRLNASLDLAALPMAPITRMLAEAAQRYGIIVRDQTHHAVGFFAEDPTPAISNPYTGARGLFDGLEPSVFLREFPWNQLQLLQMHLCTSAPCVE